MTLAFADVEIPQTDSIPELDDGGIEYPCSVCGKEAGPYGGRGPKPSKCPDHKRTNSKARSAQKVTGAASSLAAQATEVLAQINGFMVLGAMVTGLPQTAGAIAGHDTDFREQVYAALVVDPELCKYILRAGVKSGKVALFMAYAMMGVAVLPTAVVELREKKALRDAEREEV